MRVKRTLTGILKKVIKDSKHPKGGNLLLTYSAYMGFLEEQSLLNANDSVIAFEGRPVLCLDLEGAWIVCDMGEAGAAIFDLTKGDRYDASIEGFVQWRDERIAETEKARLMRKMKGQTMATGIINRYHGRGKNNN